jgi:hypothetical protein
VSEVDAPVSTARRPIEGVPSMDLVRDSRERIDMCGGTDDVAIPREDAQDRGLAMLQLADSRASK